MCVGDAEMTSLYTLGYEGADIQLFIRTLLNAGVKVVADVRAVPLSRKKGFSKRGLSAQLASAGIEYVHFVDLGNPREGRDAAKAGNTNKFHRLKRIDLFTDSPNPNVRADCLVRGCNFGQGAAAAE